MEFSNICLIYKKWNISVSASLLMSKISSGKFTTFTLEAPASDPEGLDAKCAEISDNCLVRMQSDRFETR